MGVWLARWQFHTTDLITPRFSMESISEAYALMNIGAYGKLAVCFLEELPV